ncbi:MAG: hypothetical protein M1834_003732 [Cirrosporium novae-zelandiae]|nr:MAG: hypothetical protein M1834_003732 [Cirrosporium novae-zelandiae]
MVPEPNGALRSASPVSSGHSTPNISTRRYRDNDELFAKDKHYRRYASGIERALSLFDTALQEWADYISFLGRLLKALQARPSTIAAVPSKAIVAKRLAQCLDPTLPSGVHQKALEVYGYIFSFIPKTDLGQDLRLYLLGLSTVLSFASLSVRPHFLSLFEHYILPLDPQDVRPALKAIILALLPGLEEETSEDFDRNLRLLDGFRASFDNAGSEKLNDGYPNGAYFWQCFFLASITAPNRRLGALAYLTRYLPRLGSSSGEASALKDQGPSLADEDAVTSPEPGLLIRCFAAGLGDEQLLIQRGFLDLLVTHLPLHSPVLDSKVTAEDRQRLVAAAAGVVVRRDMSLNRRLWSWFLGPEILPQPSSEPAADEKSLEPLEDKDTSSKSSFGRQAEYFRHYGLEPLTKSILIMIGKKSENPADRAKPFRICLSLMDRWEIGGQVVPQVFLPLISDVQHYHNSNSSKDMFLELFRSASVFFDGVESGLIWSEIFGLISKAFEKLGDDASVEEALSNLELVDFMVTQFNVREEEMLVSHMPLILLALLAMLSERDTKPDKTERDRKFLATGLQIIVRLAELIPERAFVAAPGATSSNALGQQGHQWMVGNDEILKSVSKFYQRNHGSTEGGGPPFSAADTAFFLTRSCCRLVMSRLNGSSSLEIRVRVFTTLIHKVPQIEALKSEEHVPALLSLLRTKLYDLDSGMSFQDMSSLCSITIALYYAHAPGFYISYSELCETTTWLVRQLWLHLSPSRPGHHVETVRCLWQLQSLTAEDRTVEASITDLMVMFKGESKTRLEYIKRFTVIWNHASQLEDGGYGLVMPSLSSAFATLPTSNPSMEMLIRPLFLVLGELRQERTETSIFIRGWLKSLPSINKIFQVLIYRLQSFAICQEIPLPALEKKNEGLFLQSREDLSECQYYLETFRLLLRTLSSHGWEMFSAVAKKILPKLRQQTSLPEETEDQLRNADVSLSVAQDPETPTESTSFHAQLVQFCIRIVSSDLLNQRYESTLELKELQATALQILHQIFQGPSNAFLAEMQLDIILLELLSASLEMASNSIQISLVTVVLEALRLKYSNIPAPQTPSQRRSSRDTIRSFTRLSLAIDRGGKESPSYQLPSPPPPLFECLLKGLTAECCRPILELWVEFVVQCLPFYHHVIFQVLLPLVTCFCKQIREMFKKLQSRFEPSGEADDVAPDSSLLALLTGLEQLLATAHDRLVAAEEDEALLKAPEPSQGFLGSMVSGVFMPENNQPRRSNSNNRLTVLLCFQDTIRICFDIWSWGGYGSKNNLSSTSSEASFNYTSLRVRNRARRILDHLFGAETLESLETLATIWCGIDMEKSRSEIGPVMSLLQVLDTSRPKNTLPAIFNAIYSRTNPNALDPSRKSTLTSEVSSIELASFLVEYARSIDDDAIDEIWNDCMIFLRDVLTNPFPQRQTLPRLLEFISVLGAKLENTNFGDQRKMRRDLGDVFLRLLTAIFTIKPSSSEVSLPLRQEGTEKPSTNGQTGESRRRLKSDDIATTLIELVPNLSLILPEPDRMASAANQISTNIISPTIHSRTFPGNFNTTTLDLIKQLTRVPNASKSWKKDVSETFNDPRFFAMSLALVTDGWLGILRQWILADKEKLLDILSRISSPTSAGIVFGVGAAAARLDADRKTQLNLRRVSLLLLALPEDTFAGTISNIKEKVVDLLTATRISSPSSATRADLFMLLRALMLKTTPIHVAALLPIINDELRSSFESLFIDESSDLYNGISLLQAAKLLDMLLVLAPDDFQLYEWTFITDTIDAVYRPGNLRPVAVIDELAEETGALNIPSGAGSSIFVSPEDARKGRRRPLLAVDAIKTVPNDELIERVLRPFFIQLSIYAFESTYKMEVPDRDVCVKDLLVDLFDESSLAS